ncbi:hypothetical protein NESM_000185400 [Novymonas esmeraldas]|uniref:Kinetoplastid PH-like domain-containing protein n=1 Tax=Novymonas esmeraldas TaxID=1808958 RepID=A0AAW0F4P4_9TRYP
MAVQLDDWSLSSLAGAMEWTVVQPTAVSLAQALCDSAVDVMGDTHTYPALFTDLTPTLLTGRTSASADAAPLVYATVSSLVAVEKVGPRQLRLRQERPCGMAGTHRLLYLTAPSEAACDQWWRVLHRLTYDNQPRRHPPTVQHEPGSDHHAVVAGACGGAAHDSDVLDSSAARSAAEFSRIAELQRLLLFTPSSPSPAEATATTTRSSHDVPLSSATHSLLAAAAPSATAATESGLPVRSGSAAQPLPRQHRHRVPRAIRGSVTALPPTDHVLARDAALVGAATATRLTASRRGSGVAGADKTSSSPSSSSSSSSSQVVQLSPPIHGGRMATDAGREADSSGAPAMTVSCRPSTDVVPSVVRHSGARRSGSTRCVAAPSLAALISNTSGDQPRDADGGAPTPFHAEAAQNLLSTPEPPPALPECLGGPSAAAAPSAASRDLIDEVCPASSSPAPAVAAADEGTALSTREDVLQPRSAWRHPPPLQHPALAGGEFAMGVSATSIDLSPAAAWPTVYEPIHVDATVVPRAHGGTRQPSPLNGLAPGIAALGSPARDYRDLQCSTAAAPLTPRLAYRHISPTWRCRRNLRGGGGGGSANTSRHASASPELRHRRAGAHGRRDDDDDGAGAAAAPRVPPRVAVVATPHLFLMYPVEVPPRRWGHGADTEGVPTYVFATIDEDCIVAVPASRFDTRLAESGLLQRRGGAAGGAARWSARRSRSSSPATAAETVAVRSLKRARRFFGEGHCRALRVSEVERVSCGTEEPLLPLLLLGTAQRERDLSKVVCIATRRRTFMMEATTAAEATWYVQSWRSYLQSRRRGPSRRAPRLQEQE